MDTLEYFNNYGYACYVSDNVNIFLNKNTDGDIGIIIVPKNNYEPILLENINDVEILWYDVSTLAETSYMANIPANMFNEYYDELVKLNL